MERPVLYIFSKKQEILLSISRCVRHTGFECRKLKHRFDPKEHTSTYFFLEEITSILGKETPEILLNAVAIIDVTDVDNDISSSLNPIIDSNETGQTVSSLILAYPEVYWIILGTPDNISSNSSDNESYLKEEHFVDTTNMEGVIKLLQCHQDGYRPLFDPSGLRTWIKNKVIKTEQKEGEKVPGNTIDILKKRNDQCSVAIDEELPYIFLNGYVAYRSGYRCYMITSQGEMDRLLKGESKSIKLSLEDLDIKLTDMKDTTSKHLRSPSVRAQNYKVLDTIQKNKRLFITGVAENMERKDTDYGEQIIDKPYEGVYHLQEYILESTKEYLTNSPGENYLGLWEQFKSLQYKNAYRCDNTDTPKPPKDTSSSHSASNRILIIADSLIERSRKILYAAKSCQDAVHGAVLALEAKELLHGRSMTTALEAVSLQHQMEVRAECGFYGVAHDIKIEPRFKDITKDVDAIININNKPELKKLAQSYNAQVEIINNIRLVFGEYEQFDEEDRCLIEVRRLRQGLHFYSELSSNKRKILWDCVKSEIDNVIKYTKSICRLVLKSVKSLNQLNCSSIKSLFIERYFNWLLASPKNIILSIMTWVVFFTLGYFLCVVRSNLFHFYIGLNPSIYWQSVKDFVALFAQSTLTFLEMQPANIIEEQFGKECTDGFLFNFVLFVELIVAYVHLGIFITYLYQKLSRR